MKGLLLAAAFFATLGLSAQTTHMVDWHFGVPTSETTITVESGDTVMWMWTDTMPHTVTSNSGVETFDSGTITGNGQSYSHIFTTVGTTNYDCIFHANMTGAITTTTAAGVKDNTRATFVYFPNPVIDVLTINGKAAINSVSVFDATGKQVGNYTAGTPSVKLYMANYPAGTYFVKVAEGDKTNTVTVVKN